jgi:spermidine synthase
MATPHKTTISMLAVFLLAMAVLGLEVALTRVFSFIMYHHFTYLVISVAMLGFGAAGTYLTIRTPSADTPDRLQFLAKMAALFGLTTIAAIVFIPRIHFYPLDMHFSKDYSNLLSLLVIILLTATPFFFGGACIAYIITGAAERINRVYFADLTGAAAGCLIALLLINTIGAVAVCFVSAAIALLVASIATTRRRAIHIIALLLVAASAYAVARKNLLPLYVPRYKQMFGKEQLVELIEWDVTARLDVTRPAEAYYSFGGALSRKYDGPAQKVRVIYQDATALTGIIQPTPTPEQTQSLGYYLQGAPYLLRPKARSLVIGCGGGPDIMIALHHGAENIVAVDINPKMIELLYKYNGFANNVFTRNDVELIAAEGRHFLSRDSRKYDVIQLSGVDTSAAQASGAYALSENFIYTVEAFNQYLLHLNEDGIVNFSRPPGWQTSRIITMWMQVLRQHQVRQPHMHIMVLNGNGLHRLKVGDSWIVEEGPWSQTMVKKSPFTEEQVHTITQWVQQLGFEVIYDPYTRRHNDTEQLILADPQQRQELIEQNAYNIKPCTDDSPFYFQFYRWKQLLQMNPFEKSASSFPTALVILLGSLVIVTGLSALFIIYPLCRHRSIAAKGGRAGIFIYFTALGLGFILLEIVLLQKLSVFLGGPAYSMSITLFTILLASGIGSFLSRNLSARPFRLLAVIIPLLALAVITELFLLRYAVPHLMYLSLPQRAAAAVLMVAPLGLLMGMPFPAGLRYVDTAKPQLTSWAWGVNACATVLGSVLCVLIGSLAGFNVVLVLAAVIYLLGWLTLALTQPRAQPSLK